MSKRLLVVSLLFALSSAVHAKDFAVKITNATLVGPIVNASENTPISYTGGVPSPVAGQLDADDSTFQRPARSTANGGAYNGEPSCGGTDFPTEVTSKYDTVTITNASSGVATINADILCNGSDSSAYVYSSFNPAAPNTGCLLADDDSGSDKGGLCSLVNFTIPVGETRVLVVTAYQNTASGGDDDFAYDVNFTGTTPVTLTNFSVD
jgi:hypothetical protein